MKPRTRTCRATGCQRVIGGFMLLCPDHWDMVPAPLRRELVQQGMWRAAGEPGAGAAYQEAVARAVAAVEEKQGRKAAAIAGPSGSLFT